MKKKKKNQHRSIVIFYIVISAFVLSLLGLLLSKEIYLSISVILNF